MEFAPKKPSTRDNEHTAGSYLEGYGASGKKELEMKTIARSLINSGGQAAGIWKFSTSFLLAAAISMTTQAWAAEAPKPATDATKSANDELLKELPFNDKTSFELAHKGFIAPLPTDPIKGPNGNMIWDPAKYNFIKEGEAAPATTNPSL